jgi:hypothetical protein
LKFKKVKSKKIYEEWQYRSQYYGITAKIFKMPENLTSNQFFHFQVISNTKNPLYNIKYSSIDELKIYPTLDDTKQAIEKEWKYIIDKAKVK